MLINMKSLIETLKNEEYSLAKTFTREFLTPLKYRGIYERIGYLTIWNDVGSIEYSIAMYRPLGGGSILYDTEL